MVSLQIKPNTYYDSITLMIISKELKKVPGVKEALVGMGTDLNLDIAKVTGLSSPELEAITPNDFFVALDCENEEAEAAALKALEEQLNKKEESRSAAYYPPTLTSALKADPKINLALISVPGRHAYDVAKDALDKNINVMLFSDNVSMEEEKKLKEYAVSKELLMMGPDCGVGYLKGVGLAAGSCYHPGCVGIVGASGSGAQEVGCLVEKLGFGISSLIGTGGRDLYPEIGGIMMLEGIRRLERDPDTKIIILVSKLADLTVMNKVLSFADIVSKPVVAIFLGAKTHDFGFTDEQIKEIVAREMRGYSAKQKYFRGLYCGGTFTEEGLIYYSSHVKNARLHSNLNTAYAEKLASHLHSEGHSILDLGSEEFTACSPHPVFDPEIRLKRFRQELQDDEVAVILLDFITGPGVAKEPVKEFAIEAKKAIAEKHITVISNICGSAEDPQNIELQAKMLRDAGVIVTDSNYQSARLAAALMSALNERG